MMLRTCALALLTAFWLALPLRGSGQVAEPTLEHTMNSIANILNSRGSISWTEELPDVFGASYSIANGLRDVKSDATGCSLSWTSVFTSSNDKLVETYSLKLAMVSGVRVQPLSEYEQAQSVQTVVVSPKTYVVVLIKTDDSQARHREFYRNNKLRPETIKPPDAHEVRVLLGDEQKANKIADAMHRASQLCAAK